MRGDPRRGTRAVSKSGLFSVCLLRHVKKFVKVVIEKKEKVIGGSTTLKKKRLNGKVLTTKGKLC